MVKTVENGVITPLNGRGLEQFRGALRAPYPLPLFLKFLPTPLVSMVCHILVAIHDIYCRLVERNIHDVTLIALKKVCLCVICCILFYTGNR